MRCDAGAVAVERIPAGPWAENSYVVSRGDDAVVVDPGGHAERIAERVARRRLRVHAILATHGHHDHVGAVAELAEAYDAPFGIHSADSRCLERVSFCRALFHGLEPVGMPPIGLDLAATAMPLRFGRLEVAAVHTPGHTPGSVCFAAGELLLTGDTLMRGRIGADDAPEADLAALRASVRGLLRGFPPGTVIHPGHGEPAGLGECAGALQGLGTSR